MIGLALRLLGLTRVFGTAATVAGSTATGAYLAHKMTDGKSTDAAKDWAFDKFVPDSVKPLFNTLGKLKDENPNLTQAGTALAAAGAALFTGNKLGGDNIMSKIATVVIALALGWMVYEMMSKDKDAKPAPAAAPAPK